MSSRLLLLVLLSWSLTIGSSAAQNAKPKPKPGKPAATKGPNFNEGEAAVWIWGNDTNKNYRLRTEFMGPAAKAWLKATCDNEMKITLNGQQVAQSSEYLNRQR